MSPSLAVLAQMVLCSLSCVKGFSTWPWEATDVMCTNLA